MSSRVRDDSQEYTCIDDTIIRRLNVTKVFDECKEPHRIEKHISISATSSLLDACIGGNDGARMVTTFNEGLISVWDSLSGTRQHDILSKKYGCNAVCAVESDAALERVIHSSTKVNNSLRLLSLETRAYECVYEGHTKLVDCVDFASKQATVNAQSFLSGAQDGTVSLWDVRSVHRQGLIHVSKGGWNGKGHVFVQYDPLTPHRFVVCASGLGEVRVYDVRELSNYPGSYVNAINLDKMLQEWRTDVCHLAYSPNGKHLLIGLQNGYVIVADVYSGRILFTLRDDQSTPNEQRAFRVRACVTGDAQYAFITTAKREVLAFRLLTPAGGLYTGEHTPIHRIAAHKKYDKVPARFLLFNPHALMMASGGRKLLLYSTETSDK